MLKLLGLVTTIVLTVSTPTKPELRRDGGSSRYTAFNPLLVPIQMHISCLGDFEDIQLPVSASTKLDIELKQPSGFAASCYLVDYKRLK